LELISIDNQISSVQRQLNLYGFKCISRGEDKGAFFHPKFKRGDWEIVKKITRYAPPKKMAGEFGSEKMSDGTVKLSPDFMSESGPIAYPPVFPSQNYLNTIVSAPPPVESSGHVSSQYNFPTYQYMNTATNASNWNWTENSPNVFTFSPLVHDFPMMQSYPNTGPRNADGSNNVGSSVTSSDSISSSSSSDKSMDDRDSQDMKNKSNSYINVVNDVVLVDPYFDLDAELDMFSEVGLSHKSYEMKSSPTTAFTKPSISSTSSKREIGVNTDLSQALHILPSVHIQSQDFSQSAVMIRRIDV
jgi:hypothetical protein